MRWLKRLLKFPHDDRKQAGWGPFNFDWLFRGWAEDIVAWDDEATTEGSSVQKVVSTERASKHFGDMLKARALESKAARDPKADTYLWRARWISAFMRRWRQFFDESEVEEPRRRKDQQF